MTATVHLLETGHIIRAIRAALEHEPRINLHRFPISIELDESDVILEGTVKDIAAKKLALELAAATRGILGVVDRLRVVPAQHMEDGEIRDHVCTALIEEPALASCMIQARKEDRVETRRQAQLDPPGVIEVAVEDGVVTLNGQVVSLAHKRLAGVLTWWVPGSCDVINGLEVTPPQEDNDDEITDAVELVLEKDPLIHDADIDVSTRHAVVTLTGVAVNDSMCEMAEFDAWYVFGVDKVVNRLTVRA